MTQGTLSFFLKIAESGVDLHDACAVRAAGYGHHLPLVREQFAQPDEQDARCAVLLCRDKVTGAPTGTLRIQHSFKGPLQLESSVHLPGWLTDKPRAELTRLAVIPGADHLTRLILMKASYLYCIASQVRWMVIGARSNSLIRIYQGLGFQDVFEPDERVPLEHTGGLPHRILAFDVTGAERKWLAEGHGLYSFMVETFHPDLKLFQR